MLFGIALLAVRITAHPVRRKKRELCMYLSLCTSCRHRYVRFKATATTSVQVAGEAKCISFKCNKQANTIYNSKVKCVSSTACEVN